MPVAPISITETNLVTVLGDFALTLVDCEVIRGQSNRVPSPLGDFVVITPISSLALATNVISYNASNPLIGAQHTKRSTQWSAQIDCYGEGANDNAARISIMLRSDYACTFFSDSGFDIQPLYAGDAKQLPFVTGESQYTERWSFDAVLQYNPIISVSQEFVTELTVNLINVDVVYPPGA